MAYRFFNTSIQCKYIKALLSNTTIPKIKIVDSTSLIFKDNIYIYKNNIIKCTKTGVISGTYNSQIIVNSDSPIVQATGLYAGTSDVLAEYEYISSYNTATFPIYLNKTYISKNDFYDIDTHIFLGEYLRFLRDMHHVDLMPFYNCYCSYAVDDVYLTSNSYEVRDDPNFKVIAIPIKFNKKYTIAIDCESTVRMKSVFYNDLGLISTNLLSESDQLTDIIDEKVLTYSKLDFKSPIVYSVPVNYNTELKARLCEQFESELKLLIQLPATNVSSIVVLEGDYTEPPLYISVGDAKDTIPSDIIEKAYLSNLSLLEINDGTNYAFANRLMEYLLFNAITPLDSIDSNFGYVQFNLFKNTYKINNIWNDNLRYICYARHMSDNNNQKLDINGYIDKDVEKTITANYSNNRYSNAGWIRSGE